MLQSETSASRGLTGCLGQRDEGARRTRLLQVLPLVVAMPHRSGSSHTWAEGVEAGYKSHSLPPQADVDLSWTFAGRLDNCTFHPQGEGHAQLPPTMLFLHHRSLFTLLITLHLAAARIIAIHATDDGFSIVNGGSDAVAGDILEFHFLSQNHSVVMGDPSTPCHPVATGGFFSGFLPTTLGENVPPTPSPPPAHRH